MKNIIYSILLAGLSAVPAFASELSIGMADNSRFTLSFDNAFYATPSTTYNVTSIQPGSHHVRMTSVPAQTIGACGLPRLLFDGWVNIPNNARVTAYAINLNQLNIASVVPLAQYGNGYYDPYNPYGSNTGYGNNGYGNNGYGNTGYGNNGYGNGNNGYPGYGNGSNCGNGGYNGGNNGGYNGGYNGGNNGGWYPPVYQGMSAADFERLKNSVSAQSFDSNRLTVAEQGVAMNHLTSDQVLQLMNLFSFESTKLDFAKYAYGKTIDRNNYYVVNSGFGYSSSVDELAAYINSWHA